MTEFSNSEIQRECKNYSQRIQSIHDEVSAMIVGRQAKILSDYNGQPHGYSKKSLKGKVITIKYVLIDSFGCQVWDGDWNHNCYIPITEIEFIERP